LTFRRSGQKVTAAGTTRGKIEFKPCGDIKAGEDAQCGKFEVFEDRATKIGRKITLNIILLPALSAKPAADATFYLAGGPGGAATNAASASFMPGLRKERDVVLVDQRGTGKSNPLQQFSRRAQRHARIFFRSLPGRKSPSL
jgi:pimeloyl-ACP methyl ester carboxylesterase